MSIFRATVFFLILLNLAPVTYSCDDPNQVCKDIANIRLLPFKGEHVDDESYNAILSCSLKVLPCLIEAVANTTPMPDPRKSPKNSNVTIGDVALFVLADITDISIREMLPDELGQKWDEKGMDTYFDYVETESNRYNIILKIHEILDVK